MTVTHCAPLPLQLTPVLSQGMAAQPVRAVGVGFGAGRAAASAKPACNHGSSPWQVTMHWGCHCVLLLHEEVLQNFFF